jgi:hypothetical protein
MAIQGIQVINIGLPNESVGSDSLYTAFTKTKDNFNILFGNSSPYNTFSGNTGIAVSANATLGTVDILNTGVTNIIAGTGIVIDQANGNVTITSTGGGNGGGSGTVTSVGVEPVSNTRLVVSGSPIVSSGVMTIDLANSGVTAGTYSYPTVTVDQYGRVTTIANANSVGTVTSVGLTTSGTGIQLSGGPITTAGNINIINTGVTRLSAGTGINLSGSNGNVTVSATISGGTVTSVGLSSSSLVVTNSPVTTTGTMTVELPSAISVTGNITGANLITGGLITATGNVTGANLITGGLITATGNIRGANLITGGLITATGNANVGNIGTAGLITATGNITGGNLVTGGSILSSGTTGIGYSTGAGSTVTQSGSRTAGVTINAISGSITLVSAAGSASYATFTVTNNKVAATDVIIINQKSGTDKYEAWISNVAAGSFNVTFQDTSGTTTETPVFNFAVIKAVAA